MIRTDTDYALRMLVFLAERSPPEGSAQTLSENVEISCGFAQKILRKLAVGGILQARPGRRGGFALRRPPEQVSLMDVIATIQGTPSLCRCLNRPNACSRPAPCRIQASLQPFHETMNAFLRDTSLSDILSQSPVTNGLPADRKHLDSTTPPRRKLA